jgi:hypothetical protein
VRSFFLFAAFALAGIVPAAACGDGAVTLPPAPDSAFDDSGFDATGLDLPSACAPPQFFEFDASSGERCGCTGEFYAICDTNNSFVCACFPPDLCAEGCGVGFQCKDGMCVEIEDDAGGQEAGIADTGPGDR